MITAIAEELPDGLMRVGKITFHPDHLLGKGCEGTFVYKYVANFHFYTLFNRFLLCLEVNLITEKWQ